MLVKTEIKEILREKRTYLATEFGVKRIGLFGSYLNSTQTIDSDIDLVVEFDRPLGFRFVEFAEYVESLFDKKVDILTPAGIKGIRVDTVAQSISDSIEYV